MQVSRDSLVRRPIKRLHTEASVTTLSFKNVTMLSGSAIDEPDISL
jgi:hypothetical protein